MVVLDIFGYSDHKHQAYFISPRCIKQTYKTMSLDCLDHESMICIWYDLYLIWFPRVLMGSPDCDKQSCETMSPDRLDRLLVPVYALQCFAPSLWAQIRRATSQYQYGGEQCLLLYLALCCALVTVILWCPDSAANKTTVGTFLGYQYSAWERCSGLWVILWSEIAAVTPAWAVDMRNVFSKLSFCRTQSRSTKDCIHLFYKNASLLSIEACIYQLFANDYCVFVSQLFSSSTWFKLPHLMITRETL